MAAENFDLDQLLQPLLPERFFSEYWEKKHLFLQRRDPDYFQGLMTLHDLETLISTSDMRYPALQLAKGGSYLAPEIYTRNVKHGSESFMGVPDLQVVSEHYRQGATVALPAIHRTWEPLGLLCDDLQAQLDHAAHANVYITPGNAAGFTPHYDTHEVFVLQIAGRKRWFLYDPPIELPHRSQVFNPQGYTAPPPMAQLDLSAGDLLYLPRGYVHSTTTSESYSAHITIGISVYTWADLAKEYLQAGIDSPQLRGALPPGFASRSELKPLLREKMIAAMDKIRTGADTEKLIDAFTRRVRASRTKRPESFRADTFVIDSQSRLQAPAPSEYKITQESTKIVLEFEGRRHIFPTEALAALRAIAERPSFRTAELTPWSTAEARLGLSRYLYDIGFLTSVQ
jgi:ribosomal protein L16 Arg81 hydroxylase